MQASKAPIVIIEPVDLESEDAVDKSFRILKVANCPSLSEKSMLTYHVACKSDCDSEDEPEAYFRIYKNSGAGQFNKDWLPLSEITQAFDTGATITSATLHHLYPSKSTNSPGFLLAVLKHVGLVVTSKANQRAYELAESYAFLAEFQALMESAAALDADDKPVKALTSATAKKAKGNKSAPAKSSRGAIAGEI